MLKKTFSALALALLSVSAMAQIRLIGLWPESSTSTVSGLRWNAETGAILDSIPTTQGSIYSGSSVLDATTGRYYFKSPTGLNMLDFAADSFAALGALSINTSVEIDMANGRIYGVASQGIYDSLGNFTGANLQLIRYSLVTGQDSVVGIVPGVWGVILDASTYNSNTGEYYVVAVDSNSNYQIVSMTTRGAFSYTMVPITEPSKVFFGLEYDNEYNILYGMSINTLTDTNMVDIYQIAPSTGVLTLETQLPQAYGIVSTTQTFDQTSSTFIVVGLDISNNFVLLMYNTVLDTMGIGVLPGTDMYELEADNSQFAQSKYGSLTAVPAPSIQQVRFYPNPARDVLRIAAATAVASYTLLDMQGRSIATGQGAEIALDGIAPGLYLLQGKLANGNVFQAKFVKE